MQSETSSNDPKVNNETSDIKKYFIDEGKFRLLIKAQQEIFNKTEVSPTMRKLVNDIITEENLQYVVSKFLAVLSK